MFSTYIAHHGIKGQKWGVRRFQNRDGSLTNEGRRRYGRTNLRSARTANLEKFGADENHNVLFVAGYSGSGKSTTALGIARDSDFVIHLDAYSEPDNSERTSNRNKVFDRYLSKRVPNWLNMVNASKDGANGSLKRHSKEYWDTVDAFREAVERFGKEQYHRGRRVIVEGVQIADDWFTIDKSYYRDKPLVVLSTNPVVSFARSVRRDGIPSSIKTHPLQAVKEYVRWYCDANRRLSDLAVAANAKLGSRYVATMFYD